MHQTQLCLGFIQSKSISVINYNVLSIIALKNKILKLGFSAPLIGRTTPSLKNIWYGSLQSPLN